MDGALVGDRPRAPPLLPQSLEVVGEVAIALLPPLDIRMAKESFCASRQA